eukprot:m.42288 g.42288  ORF g.42288 m.42288 type:complete len:1180 (+) comp33347_c0_seq6:187-3726(+)
MAAEEIDLSHLSAEEKRLILSVVLRDEEFEKQQKERSRKLNIELERKERTGFVSPVVRRSFFARTGGWFSRKYRSIKSSSSILRSALSFGSSPSITKPMLISQVESNGKPDVIPQETEPEAQADESSEAKEVIQPVIKIEVTDEKEEEEEEARRSYSGNAYSRPPLQRVAAAAASSLSSSSASPSPVLKRRMLPRVPVEDRKSVEKSEGEREGEESERERNLHPKLKRTNSPLHQNEKVMEGEENDEVKESLFERISRFDDEEPVGEEGQAEKEDVAVKGGEEEGRLLSSECDSENITSVSSLSLAKSDSVEEEVHEEGSLTESGENQFHECDLNEGELADDDDDDALSLSSTMNAGSDGESEQEQETQDDDDSVQVELTDESDGKMAAHFLSHQGASVETETAAKEEQTVASPESFSEDRIPSSHLESPPPSSSASEAGLEETETADISLPETSQQQAAIYMDSPGSNYELVEEQSFESVPEWPDRIAGLRHVAIERKRKGPIHERPEVLEWQRAQSKKYSIKSRVGVFERLTSGSKLPTAAEEEEKEQNEGEVTAQGRDGSQLRKPMLVSHNVSGWETEEEEEEGRGEGGGDIERVNVSYFAVNEEESEVSGLGLFGRETARTPLSEECKKEGGDEEKVDVSSFAMDEEESEVDLRGKEPETSWAPLSAESVDDIGSRPFVVPLQEKYQIAFEVSVESTETDTDRDMTPEVSTSSPLPQQPASISSQLALLLRQSKKKKKVRPSPNAPAPPPPSAPPPSITVIDAGIRPELPSNTEAQDRTKSVESATSTAPAISLSQIGHQDTGRDSVERSVSLSSSGSGTGGGEGGYLTPFKSGMHLTKGGSKDSLTLSTYSLAGHGTHVEVTGDVRFGLRYNHLSGTLEINVIEARKIAAVSAGGGGHSDPYVKTYLLPDKTNKGKRKTQVLKKTLNPVFNRTLEYKLSREELKGRTLSLSLWDWDRFGHNSFLGEVRIEMSHQDLSSGIPSWYPLQDRIYEEGASNRGDVLLAIRYCPPADGGGQGKPKKTKKKNVQGQLQILVKRARSLAPMDANGLSDPFVKCYLLPDKSKSTKQKTKTVFKNVNPVWEEVLTVKNVTLESLRYRVLEVSVWDYDRGSSNDFIGGARLGLNAEQFRAAGHNIEPWMDSTGIEATHWEEMLATPNNYIGKWHRLRPSMDSQI